jgi:Tol biopolymer transport system component
VQGDNNGLQDIFVRDLVSGTTTRMSVDSNGVEGNGLSSYLAISFDGSQVVYGSVANNLVPNDTNGEKDIFLRDRNANTTTRMSVDSNLAQANGRSSTPAISADGRHVAFYSMADNLVPGDMNADTDVFVHRR